ncbi:MAG: hypothetical protein AAFV51_07760 [Pseudomonadota bacterium]
MVLSTAISTVFTLQAASLPVAPPSCDYGVPAEEHRTRLEEFGFLIGDYRIFLHAWTDSGWSPALPSRTARWNGRYGLGGAVIVDEWFHTDPAQDPATPAGINVRMYDPEAEEWDMMWLASGTHEVQDLRAKTIDGVLTMWQVYPDRPNFKATFHVEDQEHWSRVSYTRDEAGDWRKQFKLSAERIPCE